MLSDYSFYTLDFDALELMTTVPDAFKQATCIIDDVIFHEPSKLVRFCAKQSHIGLIDRCLVITLKTGQEYFRVIWTV